MSQPKRWKLWQVEAQEPNIEWVKWDDYAALAAENDRFRKALKEVEKAWYAQRAMDVIKSVDAAFEQEGGSK